MHANVKAPSYAVTAVGPSGDFVVNVDANGVSLYPEDAMDNNIRKNASMILHRKGERVPSHLFARTSIICSQSNRDVITVRYSGKEILYPARISGGWQGHPPVGITMEAFIPLRVTPDGIDTGMEETVTYTITKTGTNYTIPIVNSKSRTMMSVTPEFINPIAYDSNTVYSPALGPKTFAASSLTCGAIKNTFIVNWTITKNTNGVADTARINMKWPTSTSITLHSNNLKGTLVLHIQYA